jgi:hypothetical protein
MANSLVSFCQLCNILRTKQQLHTNHDWPDSRRSLPPDVPTYLLPSSTVRFLQIRVIIAVVNTTLTQRWQHHPVLDCRHQPPVAPAASMQDALQVGSQTAGVMSSPPPETPATPQGTEATRRQSHVPAIASPLRRSDPCLAVQTRHKQVTVWSKCFQCMVKSHHLSREIDRWP